MGKNINFNNSKKEDICNKYISGGCIGVYDTKNMIYIVGTQQFLYGIKEYLESYEIPGLYINKITKNTWSLSIWRKPSILMFKKLIYDNYLNNNSTNSELILNRKYKKLIEIESLKK